MAYFGTDDATSSDDFLARLEAKINSIGITKTPSPTHQEEEEQEDNNKVNNNDNAKTNLNISTFESPGLKSPASVGTLLNDDLSLDGIPGFEDDDNNNNNNKKKDDVEEEEDLSFLLTPELKKSSRKRLVKKIKSNSTKKTNNTTTLSQVDATPQRNDSDKKKKTTIDKITTNINNGDNGTKNNINNEKQEETEGKKTTAINNAIENNDKSQPSSTYKKMINIKQFPINECFDKDSAYHPKFISNFLTGKIKYVNNEISRAVSPEQKDTWPTIFNGSGVKKLYEIQHRNAMNMVINHTTKNQLEDYPLHLSDVSLYDDNLDTPIKSTSKRQRLKSMRKNINSIKKKRQKEVEIEIEIDQKNRSSSKSLKRDKNNTVEKQNGISNRIQEEEEEEEEQQQQQGENNVASTGNTINSPTRASRQKISSGEELLSTTTSGSNINSSIRKSNIYRRKNGNTSVKKGKNMIKSTAKKKKKKNKNHSAFTTPTPKKVLDRTPSPPFTKTHSYLKKGSSTKEGKRYSQQKKNNRRRSSWKKKSLSRYNHESLIKSHIKLNEAEESISRTSKYMDNVSVQYATKVYIKAPVSKFRSSQSGRASTGSTADDDSTM